jgi:diguanylate cyclase (GGDEF)-like protein/PAS domain S-box-containing protein
MQRRSSTVIQPDKQLKSALATPQEAQSRRFIIKLLAGVVLINMLVIGYATLNLHRSWDESLVAAETRSRTIARAVDQSISSNIDKIDIALQTVAGDAEALLAKGALQPAALSERLDRQKPMLPEAAGMAVMDANGHYIYGTGEQIGPSLDVARRTYFLKLKSDAVHDLYVGAPIVSLTTNQWVVPFARRYNTARGQFAGVVVAPVKIEYFRRLLQQVGSARNDATSLRYSDLSLIARYPISSEGKVVEIGSHNISSAMRSAALSPVAEQTYRTIAPYDHIERVNTLLHLKNAPLVIVAGVNLLEHQSLWYRQLWQTLAFLMLFLLLSMLMAWLVFHYWRRQLLAMQRLTESHRQLDSAQEVGLLGTYAYDFSQGRGIASSSLYSIIGLPPAATFSIIMWEEVIFPEDLPEAKMQLYQAIQARQSTLSNEYRIIRKTDGQIRWVSNLSKFEYTPDGLVYKMSGVIQDIEARKLAEDRLRLTQEVFLHSIEGIFVTDSQGQFLEINPAFTSLSGYSSSDVRGKTPRILNSGWHSEPFYQQMWHQLEQTGHWEGEQQNRRKDGSSYTQFSRISSVRDRKGTVTRYICLASDITELREMQSRMEYLAYFDQLTGLPNRTRFTDLLQESLGKPRAEGGLIGVCYLDLDGFKQINDEWGLSAGDGILQQIALRLLACVADNGTVARIGGDEFIVLLSNLHNEDALMQAIEQLHRVAVEPIMAEHFRAKLTISIGATIYPRDGADNPEALIRNANQAMYIAKQTGKNRTHLFDAESERRLRENHDLFARILTAFQQNEFQLYYQPKVNMHSGKVIGAEALIRWLHPQQGIIPPDVFLPLVENTEFSILLGEWVIRQALQQMTSWAAAGLELPVSVNVSGYHLQRSDFVNRLATILKEFPQIQPGWLELEILETTAMEDLDQIAHLLDACMALGVRFALDDFGTGYSSLTYLRRLPVGTMKIDRSFVIDMLEDPTDHALVEGIVGLAHSLQREVIAEGVESHEHAIPLLRMGCQLAQGYGIARPMPADSVPAWVAQWRVPAFWQE